MQKLDIKCGYIHFDDPVLHDSGWLADIEHPPIRLGEKETGELDNEHIWLSNLDWDIMQQANLLNNVRFRLNNFLGDKTTNIADRLGFILTNTEQVRAFVEIMPTIFSRVMQYACTYTGITDVHQESLCKSLRQVLIKEIDNVMDPPERAKYFDESKQNFTSTIKDAFEKEEEKLELFIPPDAECNFIFSQYYPKVKANWKILNLKNKDEKAQLIDLKKKNACGLVKVSVYGFTPAFEKFYNFGYATSKQGSRQWVTLDEAIFLSCEAEHVEFKEVFYTEETFRPDALKEIKNSIPERSRYSLSGMIFLHNLWRSMAVLNINRWRTNTIRVNTMAPFVRFYDRYLCMTYALELYKQGFRISGYGSGKIYIGCENIDPIFILTGCRTAGLIPPILNVKLNEDNIEYDSLTKILDIQQYLWGHGNLDVILDYDDYCMPLK